MSDLKPCPFCGDRLEYSSVHSTWAHTEWGDGCIASAILIFDEDDRDRWNTRTEDGKHE